MIVIILISFLLGLIAAWDLTRRKGLVQLLKEKRLEFLVGLALIDFGKGILLYFYSNNQTDSFKLILLVSIFLFFGGIIRYFFSKTIAQYLVLLGFVWPIYPQVFNTIFFMAIIFLYSLLPLFFHKILQNEIQSER